MVNGNHILTAFLFYLKTGLREKRTKMFFLFAFIPVVVLAIIRIVQLANPQSQVFSPALFTRIAVAFYFQLFIQLLALFYGSSVIGDEVDNKTLVYITTTPISKPSIVLGKYAAKFVTCGIIVTAGLTVAFLVSSFGDFRDPLQVGELLTFIGVALLSTLTYSSLFTLLGSLLKKSILLGVLFIFGWESVVQYFPGSTQKLTIGHYIKSLLPPDLTRGSEVLTFHLQPSPVAESIITLLFLCLVFLSFTIFVFRKKEYILSDQV